MSALHDLGVRDAAARIRRRELSSAELTRAALARIAAVDEPQSARSSRCRDGRGPRRGRGDRPTHRRRRRPRAARRRPGRRQGHHLHRRRPHDRRVAHPRATSCRPTTPPSSRGCKRAGAVLLGKLNCDEFAMGSSTENSAFGPTRNPWDADARPRRIVGRLGARRSRRARSPAALGTDTGGSIRQPAAFCGVVGLKPTYGRVSRYGVIAFASSLDQVGPFARDVGDAAVVLEAIAGHDPRDSTVVAAAGAALRRCARRAGCAACASGCRRSTSSRACSPRWTRRCAPRSTELRAARRRRRAGLAAAHRVRRRHLLPDRHRRGVVQPRALRRRPLRPARGGPGGSLGEMYERSRAAGFGAEVKRRIMLGTYALSAGYYDAYYLKAQQVRTLIRRDFEQALRALRRARHAGRADHGLPHRREDRRPAHDVPLRHLHHLGEPRRPARPRRPVRRGRRPGCPSACRSSASPSTRRPCSASAPPYEQATDWHRRNPLP